MYEDTVEAGAIHPVSPDITQRFEARRYVNFESNELTNDQLAQFNSRVDLQIAGSTDETRTALLQELKGHVNKRRRLFPELSHGTSSDALPGLVSQGVRPRDQANQLLDPQTQRLGEGARLNLRRGTDGRKVSEVYMGAGQGGLGTTIAYARMIDEPRWNPNSLDQQTIEAEIASCTDTLAQVEKVDWEAEAVLKDRLASLKVALARRQQGIPPDYPIIVGTSGSESIDPSDRRTFRFKNSIGRIGGPLNLNPENGFDSEVAVTIPPNSELGRVTTIAVPRERIAEVMNTVAQAKRLNIDLISVEALMLLPELGFARIQSAHHQGTTLLNGMLDYNDKLISRGLRAARGEIKLDFTPEEY